MTDAIDELLDVFYAKFTPEVITLAEICIDAAHGGFLRQVPFTAAEGNPGGEDDSEHAAVFRECIALYAEKHGIDAAALAEATTFYREITARAQVLSEMQDVIDETHRIDAMVRRGVAEGWLSADMLAVDGSVRLGEAHA